MGRTLEALKQVGGTTARLADRGISLRPFQDSEEAGDDETDATIPFIEVGGPRTVTDLTPPAIVGFPEMRELPRSPASATPVGVAFQPLALAPATLPPPRERFATDLIAFHQPRHMISCQYRAVVEGIEAQLPGSSPQVLLFTAPAPEIRTTGVLLNVAVTMAGQNRLRVAVVDANWNHAAVAEKLGLPASPGLRDVLAQTVTLERALQPSGLPNLMVLTAGALETFAPRPVGEPMWTVLGRLREEFDLVLVDAPHWDSRPEIVALGSACDAVYLVLQQDDEEDRRLAELMQLMPRQGCPLRGCVLIRND